MGRALEGTRVVDFTWWRAGPWSTSILAALGAQVIRVEWPEYPLAFRRDPVMSGGHSEVTTGAMPGPTGESISSRPQIDKLSVTVNLGSPKGLELVKQLISRSDLVIENFSAGVLA